MTLGRVSDKAKMLNMAKEIDGKKLGPLESCSTAGNFDVSDSNICTYF